MTGIIYRVTVYDGIIPPEAIERHSDAYNDVARLPIILSFAANPEAIFSPNSSTLAWNVQGATALFINGVDVTSASNLVVSPTANTKYTLLASNAAGVATRSTTVQVNPSPVINSFTASRTFIAAGENISLNWNVSYGESFSIAPSIGDVAARTTDGIGSTNVQPATPITYILTAGNAFGMSTASVAIQIVQPASHLVISEFMADNESTLADQDGDFEGWIEIHNPTAAAIDLAGHFLTDDEANPTKWAFPTLVLAPNAYLVVFASGKDRTDAAAPLHTNFRLNNDGEYLALVGPGPLLLHAFAPAFPSQRADVSYGLLGDDVSLVRYLGVPTPGAPNNETAAPPAPVEFSIASGFFTNAFSLALSTPDPSATIRFTTNGSVPSATNGIVFAAPLSITNTTRIRAIAILSNQLSQIRSVSYIRLANDLAGYTSSLPMLVIENFGAGTIPQKGWSGTGAGIKQVPRQSAVWATFSLEGGASALTNSPQMFSDIGIRGRGAFSSTWRQKPYSVEALDANGDERDVSPLGMPRHSEWVLYFPDPDDNKDPTLLFNTFPYELSEKTGHYAVRFRWVEAFINEDGGDLRLADRRGVYAIIEKVSRGKDRLDFQKLSDDGASGSWLVNINRMDAEPESGWP
ncbi:MAG TPA: lamin tail domain-containing protein, partial [Tepidisphaeraceae bacterium]|nr:lamin tail domain-containing protein [Tepidisphaeraceae bacterium]